MNEKARDNVPGFFVGRGVAVCTFVMLGSVPSF